MRARLVQLAFACALLAAAAFGQGCGEDGDAAGGLAAAVPPDVPLYAEAVLRPDDDQRAALESLTSRVAGIDDPGGELIARLDAAIAAAPGDFTYADDVEPWLGDRGSFFVRSFDQDGGDPDGALEVEVTDTEAAQDFIDSLSESDPETAGSPRSYDGVDYMLQSGDDAVGLVGDNLVVGTTEAGFKVAVDAAHGESLAESEEFAQRTEALDDEALGLLYLEPAAAIQAAVSSGELGPDEARIARGLLAGPLSEPIALSLSATEETASIDAVASVDGAAAVSSTGLLSGLPADAWIAAEIPDAGPLLQRWLDALEHSGVPRAASIEKSIRAQTGLDPRRDVAGWLGDLALFYRGTDASDVAVGVIAETTDPEGPRALVDRLAQLAEAESPLPLGRPPAGADYGFTVGLPVVGPRAEVGVVGARLVATLGETVDRLLEPDATLAGSDAFGLARDQLGDEFVPVAYLDLPRAYELAVLGADDPVERAQYESWRPYVEQLGSFVAGARVEDRLLVSRLVVTVAQ